MSARFVAVVLALWFSSQATAAPERPGTHPHYAEAIRAIRYEKWKDAVPLLRLALKNWPEDGELTRLYGAWFKPYLPELYLGVSLFHLGCFAEAKQHLDASVLREKSVSRAEEEERLLAELTDRIAEQLRLGTPPPAGAECKPPK